MAIRRSSRLCRPRKNAAEGGAHLVLIDESGFLMAPLVRRSQAPRGKTPVVPASGRRFGCNTLSAVSNLGRQWFMVFGGRFNAGVFIAFLGRLPRAVPGRKLVLIVDSHPAHKAARVKRWVAVC